jgi:hypothetical protein
MQQHSIFLKFCKSFEFRLVWSKELIFKGQTYSLLSVKNKRRSECVFVILLFVFVVFVVILKFKATLGIKIRCSTYTENESKIISFPFLFFYLSVSLSPPTVFFMSVQVFVVHVLFFSLFFSFFDSVFFIISLVSPFSVCIFLLFSHNKYPCVFSLFAVTIWTFLFVFLSISLSLLISFSFSWHPRLSPTDFVALLKIILIC